MMNSKKAMSQRSLKSYRQVLTSTEANVRWDRWHIRPRDLKLKSAVAWSVRKLTLHGGKQEGVDLVLLDNGKLRISIIPTRGMGVLKVEMGDVRLGWNSPVTEVVHPKFVNLPTRGGLGWLDGFNEWMVRCGLENCGAPGRDQFVTNTGAVAEMDLWLHGKIANIPASKVEVLIDRAAPHRITVRGRVDERMFYGPKLELWTEISTEPGASTFRIADTVTNRGAAEQEFQLLYHANFGPPLLEAGARFVAPLEQVLPMNDVSARAVSTFNEYSGPTPGFVEQVYCLRPLADGHGLATMMLQNAAADRAASMRFALEQLPCTTLWKSTGAEADGYVTGIEPATGFPHTRRIERQFGRVPRLGPGQSRGFVIDYGIHVGKTEVAEVARQLARIQAGRSPKLETQPARTKP